MQQGGNARQVLREPNTDYGVMNGGSSSEWIVQGSLGHSRILGCLECILKGFPGETGGVFLSRNAVEAGFVL